MTLVIQNDENFATKDMSFVSLLTRLLHVVLLSYYDRQVRLCIDLVDDISGSECSLSTAT